MTGIQRRLPIGLHHCNGTTTPAVESNAERESGSSAVIIDEDKVEYPNCAAPFESYLYHNMGTF